MADGYAEIGLQKQEKSNPFFTSEADGGLEAVGRRELYHSKSVLTNSGAKQEGIMSPEAKMFTQHSKTNSGALISQEQ